MDPLIYRKNTVPPRQRIYQADMRPVYQRLPGSKMYMTGFLVLFYTGLAGVGISYANVVMGKQAKTDE